MRTFIRLPALCLLMLACAPVSAVSARFSPAQPIVEPTQKGLELNFDLLIHNESNVPITLTRLEISYFDTLGREVLRRELSGRGAAPNIETISQRRIDAGAEWLFFNPFPEVPSGFDTHRVQARLSFSAEDGETREVSVETTTSTRRPTQPRWWKP